jgi:hypothetical protein
MTCSLVENRKRFQKGKKSKKSSWVRPPVRVIPVALKINKQDRRKVPMAKLTASLGNYRNKVTIPTNCPGFDSQWKWFSSSGNKCNRRTTPRPKNQTHLFWWGDYRNKEHNPEKSVQVRVSVKILGWGIFVDIFCYSMTHIEWWGLWQAFGQYWLLQNISTCQISHS